MSSLPSYQSECHRRSWLDRVASASKYLPVLVVNISTVVANVLDSFTSRKPSRSIEVTCEVTESAKGMLTSRVAQGVIQSGGEVIISPAS